MMYGNLPSLYNEMFEDTKNV